MRPLTRLSAAADWRLAILILMVATLFVPVIVATSFFFPYVAPRNIFFRAIIDRGIWGNWGIPGIIISVAAFLVWLLVTTLRSGTPLNAGPVAGDLLKNTSQNQA